MGDISERVRAAIDTIRSASEAEGLDVGLRPPATASELDAAEAEYGSALPEAVRAFYLVADGQRQDPRVTPLLGEWPVASLARARRESNWQREFWKISAERDAAIEGHESAQPEVLAASWHRRWWPFGFWQGSEMLIVDQAPTESGVSGQLIVNGSHVMEAVPWVAPGLLELLEALADGVTTGLVGLRRYGIYRGGTRWHVGPAGVSLEHAGRALFDEPGPADPRIAAMPPEWRDWVLARGARFAHLLTAAGGLIAVPPGTRDLAPLALFPDLRWLDLTATVLPDLGDLPDLPRLRDLVVRGAGDLTGIGRFPVSALAIIDPTDLRLDGLDELATPVGLEVDGTWSGVTTAKVGTLMATALTAEDAQRALDLRSGTLRLILGDVDVAVLDWTGCPAHQVDIVGGNAESFEFVSDLQPGSSLSFYETGSVDLTGLPADTEVRLAFSSVPMPANVEVLSHLRPPASIAAPASWWHACGAETDPLIWSGLRDTEDGSEDQELSRRLFTARHEWDNARNDERRAQIMKERGLS